MSGETETTGRASARPKVLGDMRAHYHLAVGMANRTGADLQAALESGAMDHAEWADLVQKCRACDWTKGCACWLQAQEPGGADAPAKCPNGDFFDSMKAVSTD